MNVSLTEQDLINIKMTVLTLERQEIARNIDPRRFFSHLRAKYIFDERDCDEIRSVSSRIGSAEAFVDILKRKGAKGYDEFCAALMTDRTQLFLLQQMTQTLEQLRARVLDKKKELALTKSQIASQQQGVGGPSNQQQPYNHPLTYPLPPTSHPQPRPIGPHPPFPTQPHPPPTMDAPPHHMFFHSGNGNAATFPLGTNFNGSSSSNGSNNTTNGAPSVHHNKQLRKVHSRTSNSDDFPEQYTRQSSYPFQPSLQFIGSEGQQFNNSQFNSLPPPNSTQFNFNPSNTQFNPPTNTQFNPSTNTQFNPSTNTQFNPSTNTQQYNITQQFNPSAMQQFNPKTSPPVFSPTGQPQTHFNQQPPPIEMPHYSYNRTQSSPNGYASQISPTASLPFRPILTPSGESTSPHDVFGGVRSFSNSLPNYYSSHHTAGSGHVMMDSLPPQGQQPGLVCRGFDESDEKENEN